MYLHVQEKPNPNSYYVLYEHIFFKNKFLFDNLFEYIDINAHLLVNGGYDIETWGVWTR